MLYTMKEIPMLFSDPMVVAIDVGQKTETRRTRGLNRINVFPDRWSFVDMPSTVTMDGKYRFRNNEIKGIEILDIKCPFGKPGDVIWVREAHEKCKRGFRYRAGNISSIPVTGKWKPSIHMPKKATRHWLKIKAIRVERLHEINEVGAINEGVQLVSHHNQWLNYLAYITATPAEMWVRYPRESFRTLWIKINGEFSWKYNPWVWVIQFEKINHKTR